MRDFIANGESGASVRAKINELAATGPSAWDAYRDFSDVADGTVINTNAYDMLGNRFLAAGGSTPELWQVTSGVAYMGGRDWVALGNAYMALKPAPIRALWGEFVLTRPSGGVTNDDSSSLAMVITNDETLSLSNLLHPFVTRLGWVLQLRVDGGTLTTVASGTWATPLSDDGVTRHQFAMVAYPERGYLVLLWPGVDAATGLDHRVISSTSFPRAMGALAYWQENRTDVTKVKPGMTRIGLIAQKAASRVQYLTSTTTLTLAFNTHLIRPSGASQVFTLPAANTANGHVKSLSVPGTASDSVSISGSFWDGTSSKTIAPGAALRIVADTVNNVWAVL